MTRIGISACYFHPDPERLTFKGKTLLYLEQSLAHWVMSAGVPAFLIPSTDERSRVDLKTLVAELDGLVLQGGADVSPRSYGEEPMRPEWEGDKLRDDYELNLFRTFLEAKKPVLGVCRGAQLMNVALGGTLFQDIPTQAPSAIVHKNWDIYDQNAHDLIIEKGSRLETIYHGTPMRPVSSVHHQGIKQPGHGVVPEAHAPDGIIEAFRVNTQGYAYAVQWHPEFHYGKDFLDSRPLLDDFLAAC